MAVPTVSTAPAAVPASTGTPGALPASIAGIGAALPQRVVTNDDLALTLDTSDEWISTRTGIRRRHLADPDTATSDLALTAARAALADAGVEPRELDAVVVATTTPDHPMPGTAPQVAAALGLTVTAFDVAAACAGFLYALQVGVGLLATGHGAVLVIGAETLSRIVDWSDRATAVLFGDGAGAAVLTRGGAGEIGPFDLGSDGSLREILWIPAGGSRRPVDADTAGNGEHCVHMQGGEVYRHAVARMVASAGQVLDAAGLDGDDVDLFVAHQANSRILDAVARRVGIGPERCHLTVDRHGNTSAASIPLALADAHAAGRLRPGSRVLTTAFGAGLTWASCLLTWPGTREEETT